MSMRNVRLMTRCRQVDQLHDAACNAAPRTTVFRQIDAIFHEASSTPPLVVLALTCGASANVRNTVKPSTSPLKALRPGVDLTTCLPCSYVCANLTPLFWMPFVDAQDFAGMHSVDPVQDSFHMSKVACVRAIGIMAPLPSMPILRVNPQHASEALRSSYASQAPRNSL
eukprot:3758986-Amphidinium_carterae.2